MYRSLCVFVLLHVDCHVRHVLCCCVCYVLCIGIWNCSSCVLCCCLLVVAFFSVVVTCLLAFVLFRCLLGAQLSRVVCRVLFVVRWLL